jgi:GNAT superfamily N-acetyltransferase
VSAVRIVATPVDAPEAVDLLRAYMTEMVARYQGRPAREDEVDAVLAEDPSDGLATFLIAHLDGVAVGCAGLRRLSASTVEVKRMYVAPAARGHGVGRRLLAAVEDAGRRGGATTVRLDTRADLTEARGLYESVGYAAIPRYNDSRYAECWYQKRL